MARVFRVWDYEDPQSIRMPQLRKPAYYAVQRALKNIWFGEAAPIQEAVNHICMDEVTTTVEEVKLELARLVNLILQKIVDNQDGIISQITSYEEERIRNIIIQGKNELSQLNSEERALRREIQPKENIVRDLRKRQRYLDSQEVMLRKKVEKLEENEKEVQLRLKSIMDLNPVEFYECLAVAQQLAQSEIEKE